MSDEITVGSDNSKKESNSIKPEVKTRTQQSELPAQASEQMQERAKEAEIPVQFIDTEFQVPTDEVELPSKGMFYPNRKDTVEIKCLTAEDENILTSSDLIKSGKVLDVLLANSIIDRDITPEEMLSGDRNAVLMSLRTTGYGDEYEVNMTCPSCSQKQIDTVLLSELKTKDVSDKPDADGLFSVLLPRCKANINFRLLTGADEARLQKISEHGKRSMGGVKVQTLLTEKYLLQIMSVNGNVDKTYIKKFISVMPIADSLFFREYIKEVEPGIDLNQEFHCNECGHDYNTDIPITAKLFWPNAKI